jgi:hypothetical protein
MELDSLENQGIGRVLSILKAVREFRSDILIVLAADAMAAVLPIIPA